MIPNRKPCAQKPDHGPRPRADPASAFHARMIPMFFLLYDAQREFMSFPQKIMMNRRAEIDDVQKSTNPSVPVRTKGFDHRRSILALTSSFRLLLALDAGLLVMLPLSGFCKNAGTSGHTLKATQCALQRLILSNTYLRHVISLPSQNLAKRQCSMGLATLSIIPHECVTVKAKML